MLLDPYDNLGAFSGRIRVAVPRMGVGEHSANALAMVMHELATNSVKHGALSSEVGSLDISGAMHDEERRLIWAETGGPQITDVPQMQGFGSVMILQLAKSELGGFVEYDWQHPGLVATVCAQVKLLKN